MMNPLSPETRTRRSYRASSRANNGNEVSRSASDFNSPSSSPSSNSLPAPTLPSPLAINPADPLAYHNTIQSNFRQIGDDVPDPSVQLSSPPRGSRIAPMSRPSCSSVMSLSPVHTSQPSLNESDMVPYTLDDDSFTEIECDCACFGFFNRLLFGAAPSPRHQAKMELKREVHIRPYMTTPPPVSTMPNIKRFAVKRNATVDVLPSMPESSDSVDSEVEQRVRRRSFSDFSSAAANSHSNTSYLLNNMPSFVKGRQTTGEFVTLTSLRTEEMVTLTRQRTEEMLTLTRQITTEDPGAMSRQATGDMPTTQEEGSSTNSSPMTLTKI